MALRGGGMYVEMEKFLAEWHNDNDRILVHTSGSTGAPKPMWVEKKRMLASARITCDYLALHPGDSALLCMPLEYIAGKMMVVRAIERELNLYSVHPSNHPLAEDEGNQFPTTPFDLIAMVPSQVYCSLQVPKERQRLMAARHIIIGGGAVSKEMEDELRSFPNAVWSTYGMTETLSHIALRRLNGPDASEWYEPFSSVNISLTCDRCLAIDAPLVHDGVLATNDIAEIASDGRHFRIIGRKDNVICSGGIKLQIEQMEEQLALPLPFCVTKLTDAKFGEIAVLLTTDRSINSVSQLPPLSTHHFLPTDNNSPVKSKPLNFIKHIFHVDAIPLTATGKIDRHTAMLMAGKLHV